MQITVDADGPLLIFGGPYSNLQAASALKQTAERLGIPPGRTICTGDVVAYCAEPEATVQRVRDWGCHVIKGNCEESLAARAPDCGCGFDDGSACDLLSKGWYPFADKAISAASREWMAALPDHLSFSLGGKRVRVIHGGVAEQNRFIFASTPKAIKHAGFASADAEIMIAGHCGIPFIEPIGDRLWFNPGVIGMPANDGTSDGWYGLVTPENGGLTFSIHRLRYDAERAAGTLRDTGFAPAYADSLTGSLWPSLDVLPEAERAATGAPLAEMSLKVSMRENG